jgi:hypothetical protein
MMYARGVMPICPFFVSHCSIVQVRPQELGECTGCAFRIEPPKPSSSFEISAIPEAHVGLHIYRSIKYILYNVQDSTYTQDEAYIAWLKTRPTLLPSPATPCNQQIGRIFNGELEERIALGNGDGQEGGSKS